MDIHISKVVWVSFLFICTITIYIFYTVKGCMILSVEKPDFFNFKKEKRR